MARIIAVCKSEKKGTKKESVAEGVLKENHGLGGDTQQRLSNESAECATETQTILPCRNINSRYDTIKNK